MVRVWCVPCRVLDRQHLLGEHYELHVMWGAIQKMRHGVSGGWQKHPQTLRFVEEPSMLIDRHNEQALEMHQRGYNHKSPIAGMPSPYIYTKEEEILDMMELEKRGALND